jgi:Xaa-Pro aminopeptidase
MELRELKNRRKALVEKMPKNSIAILSSANRNYRTRDVENPYRQDSDFLYMTGISEPNLINIVFEKSGEIFSVLFRNNTSEHEKIWDGSRLENSDILENSGFSEVQSYDDYKEKILNYIIDKDSIYIESGLNPELDDFIYEKISKSGKNNRKNCIFPKKIVALHSVTQKLRLIKSDYEIGLIKKAAEVSIIGHQEAMKKSKPGIYEYELDAEIKYVFNKNNMHFAYMSIVGSGNNACTLHYIKNNNLLKDKDLVLIDAAAENQGYASDITRTFPVNGKYTKEQALIYDVVLNAQEKAIEFIKPGVTWEQVHEITVEEISKGLVALNLVPNDINRVINEELYKDFFMHKTGHWLGLDVHDVGEYENILFEPGMVITVEPGIYINLINKKIPKKWRGIGVRIEDDVLITKNGNEVITKNLVKKRNEVELMCSASDV